MRRWRALSIVAAIAFAALATPGRLAGAGARGRVPGLARGGRGRGRRPRPRARLSVLRLPERPPLQRGRARGALGRAAGGRGGPGLRRDARRPGARGRPGDARRCATVAGRSARGPTPTSRRQFKAIILLVFLITAILYFASAGEAAQGTSASAGPLAFFMGATFSWLVGFVGMSLAVRGNLRVAAAARTSYGAALQLGYRTGTITGMLTDGLGLLGGTVIFMAYGEHAYEVLLGFGFGGTLLALFMRVGGGIYTKAADVGADLVGKVEAGHPRGRPPQRRDDRRQRRRQRRRLRRDGRRHLRELRGDDRRRDDPGLRQLRPQGGDLPAAGPGHRRRRLDHQHVQRQGRAPTAPATRRCTRSTAGFILGSIISVVGFFAARASATCTSTTTTSREYPAGPRRLPADRRVRRRPQGDSRRRTTTCTTATSAEQKADGVPRRSSRTTTATDPRRRPADLGELRLGGARHAAGLDLPDRHHPGHRPEQGARATTRTPSTSR